MFIKNREYYRDRLTEFVGSNQRQSGIIYGDLRTDCVIITSGGKSGKEAGYGDKQNPDGTWTYIGQGQSGDQNPEKYSNSLLIKGERSVLLFTTREPNSAEVQERGTHKKLYKFEGVFQVLNWKIIIPEKGSREGDKLIQFTLIPAKNIFDDIIVGYEDEIESVSQMDREKLNLKLDGVSEPRETFVKYRLRSQEIKDYALNRANGICECCDQPAPFFSMNHKPFLEVHHIFRLADDGPDIPENVAAICPNCHREAHFGMNQKEIENKLKDLIKEKES